MGAEPARWRRLDLGLPPPVLQSDSVTVFDSTIASGAVIVSGSHGAASAIAYVLAAGARAVIVNDAGVGKDGAGISGLAVADAAGLAVAAVAHASARIGDAADTVASGRVSHRNRVAAACGVEPAMDVPTTIAALAAAEPPPGPAEARPDPSPPRLVAAGPPPVYIVDSAVHIGAALEGAIVVTGSHGGAAHGRALDADVLAAAFNDAGIGKERAGLGRLAFLEASGTPGMTVSHESARIGDAQDAWESGIISALNPAAAAAGVRVGQRLRAAVAAIAAGATAGVRG